MVNLVIDIGNSSNKYGVFEQGVLIQQYSFPVSRKISQEVSQLTEIRKNNPQIGNAILCSTRNLPPEVNDYLNNWIKQLLVMEYGMRFPIELAYKTPETLGLDRIAALVGAWSCFPGKNVLVVDVGTAITIDLLNANGVFVGGNISPGLDLRFESLHQYTDKLPRIVYANDVPELGTTTEEAIRAGVQNGILYELEYYFNTLKNKYNGLTVILTGGGSSAFVKKLKKTIFVDQNLVLNGLNAILAFHLDQ